MAKEKVTRKLAAILAADVVGYSRLVDKDEEGTIARLRERHLDLRFVSADSFQSRDMLQTLRRKGFTPACAPWTARHTPTRC